MQHTYKLQGAIEAQMETPTTFQWQLNANKEFLTQVRKQIKKNKQEVI